MVSATVIIGIVVVIIVIFLIYLYNTLIKLRLRVNNAWSQIDVQLKRRYDLIPNLVSAVKGYMKHEKSVLENVTKMRAALVSGSLESRAKASNQITEALKSIFAVAESYPGLKANENFKQLQEELSGTESKIAYSRQFYNDSVMHYNQAIQTFPNQLFANMFKFKSKDFFGATAKERDNVTVEF